VFIQIIQGKCSRQDELRAMADRWREEVEPKAMGWLGGTYGFSDDGQFIGVIRFDSKESAMENSRRPEQSAWWAEVERLFDGPVEFHDCDTVVLMMKGGSDDAGFVQVVRGKMDKPEALESGMHTMETMLHDMRPEIIGATFAIEPDGTFTETVAFTDEASARAGESKEMPMTDEVRNAMRTWDSMVHDLSYIDLRQPWFTSRT
jgi:hypothetical protein